MPGIVLIGIIIFIISFIGFNFYAIKEFYEFNFFDNIFAPIFLSVGLSLVLCLIIGVFHSWAKIPVMEPAISYNLVNIKDEENKIGDGYLYQFIQDDDLKYFYIFEDEIGIKQTTVSTNDCYIRYINNYQKPMIYIYNYTYTSNYTNWLLGPPDEQMYVFCIPKESIIIK